MITTCPSCGRPRLLDLFCCAGGAAMGYHRAGFCVTGVDNKPQPRYPFQFIQGDALLYLAAHGHEYAAVHTSPPCQAAAGPTVGTNAARNARTGRTHPQLIPATRHLLDAIGRPYVIENVKGAPLRRDVELCGEMFGLAVIRHRWFELGGWSMEQPAHLPHRGRVAGWRHGTYYEGPYFAVYGDGGGKGSVADWQRALGIDWTAERAELSEAIPPAYTEHLGAALLASLTPPLERTA